MDSQDYLIKILKRFSPP